MRISRHQRGVSANISKAPILHCYNHDEAAGGVTKSFVVYDIKLHINKLATLNAVRQADARVALYFGISCLLCVLNIKIFEALNESRDNQKLA